MSWLSVKQSIEQLGVSRSTLNNWRTNGCPHLGDRNIRTQISRRQGRGQVLCITYLQADVEQISRRLTMLASRTKNEPWLTFLEAKELFGFEQAWLYDWHENGCPYLNGANLRARQEHVLRGSRLHKVWTYSRDQLEKIAGEREALRDGTHKDSEGVWLTARAAYAKYGLWDANLAVWRGKACSFLDGQRIRAKPIPQLAVRKGRGAPWAYHEEDLQRIAAARQLQQPAVYQDDEGTWLFAQEVSARYGLPADNLWFYRKKSYPFLPGGKLRAKRVPGANHPYPPAARGDRWVYFDEDLRRIDAIRSGRPDPGASISVSRLPPPAELVSAEPSATTSPKRRRGRPAGSIDKKAADRNKKMRDAWKAKEYDSIAELARAFHVSRPHASDIVNG